MNKPSSDDIQVLIDCAPGERRAALIADGRLVELAIERADRPACRLGDVFRARVRAVHGGAGGSFLDLGPGGEGFLPLKDGPGNLTEGRTLTVQVVREACAGKGPRLSARPVLVGRYLELTRGRAGVHFGRGFPGGKAREQIAGIVEGLDVGDFGLTLRAAAASADEAALRAECAALAARLAAVADQSGGKPGLIEAGPGAVARLLRDAPATVAALIADGKVFAGTLAEEIAAAAPDLRTQLEWWREPAPLFDEAGIDEAVDEALSPEVPLANGGRIVIEGTTALTVIDVDAGGRDEGGGGAGGRGRTLDAVNLDAASEIGRQLRLRNLGGQVVVDFISTRDKGAIKRTLDRLRAAVDPNVNLFGATRLGLVEMVRERRTPTLAEIMLAPCPTCHGRPVQAPETAALALLRTLIRRRIGGRPFEVRTAPAVAAALAGPLAPAAAEVAQRMGRPLVPVIDPDLAPDRFSINERGIRL